MLTFFRRIRKGLLNSGATGKYILYSSGEILLVMIGILLALQVNNWNEDKKQKTVETKVLNDIKNALASDISNQFAKHMKRINTDVRSLNVIFNHVENHLPYHDNLDAHYIVLSRAGGRLWAPQITAYKLLESLGIDLITSDPLKNSILNIYNLAYPEITASFENYKKNIYDYARPIARRQFHTDSGMFTDNYEIFTSSDVMRLTPINYAELSSDVEFLNVIKSLKLAAVIDLNHLKDKKENVQNVIRLIDIELNR